MTRRTLNALNNTGPCLRVPKAALRGKNSEFLCIFSFDKRKRENVAGKV